MSFTNGQLAITSWNSLISRLEDEESGPFRKKYWVWKEMAYRSEKKDNLAITYLEFSNLTIGG